MAEFYYEALEKGGKQVRGAINAPSQEVITEKLRGLGYYPLLIVEQKTSIREFDLFNLPVVRTVIHRATFNDLVVFTRQLSTLLDAGLPLLRALYILREQSESTVLKEKIALISTSIEGGSSLSDALSKHPKIFDNLYVNMVRAGEIDGVMEVVLNKIALFLEKRRALVGKVRSALIYPAVVSGMAVLIVGFILWKVLPRFAVIFEELGAELPWLTQQLINASDILIHETWKLFAVVGLVILAYREINKTKIGKLTLDRLKLKIPVLGRILQKAAIARFASTFSTLLSAGVPILQSLDIVRDTTGNAQMALAMDKMYHSVKEGNSINEPMRCYPVFPPLVVNMIAIGEETGEIDQLLNKVAEAYEQDVENSVNALTSILEPIMIITLGIIIGVMVVALYLPMISMPTLIK